MPKGLVELITALGRLPGVGSRTAERYAYYLLKNNPQVAEQLAEKLVGIHGSINYCRKTFALIDRDETLSRLYTDPRRDKSLVAVVAEPFDIVALEKTNQYYGTYHVLGGLLSPIDGIEPENLHIAELVARIKDDKVKEIILATNASTEGETTALYIQQQIGNQKVKITRLARGLPVGIDLEYADQLTLGRALEGRTIL